MTVSSSASCKTTAFPVTKERRLTRLPGAATAEGPEFEFKLSGLLALRAFKKKHQFELFSNVKDARPLDDIVLRLVGPTLTFFVQLKHSRPGAKDKTVTEQAFTTDTGDFSLRKYMNWFSKLYERHKGSGSSDLLSNTSLENIKMVIFTTKDAVPNMRLRHSNAPAVQKKIFPFEDLFYTSKDGVDDVFSFDSSCPKVWNLFEGDDRKDLYQTKFLQNLKIFCNQVRSGELDEKIGEELFEVFGRNAKKFLPQFLNSLRKWSENNDNDYCLSNEILLGFFGQQLRRTALETVCQDLEFKPESLNDLRAALRNATSLLRVTMKEVKEPGLRAAKVLQAARTEFGDDAWLYVDDSIFEGFHMEVLMAAAAGVRVVIVDVQRPKCVALAKTLVESLGNGVLQVALGKANVCDFEDIWRLRDLTDEAQKILLEQTINFQGKFISLQDFGGMWSEMSQEATGDLLTALAGKQSPKFGNELNGSEDEMLPRRLSHYHKVSSRVLTDRSALSGARLVLQGFPKELLLEAARRLGFLNSQQDEREENDIRENPRWTVLNYKDEPSPNVTKEFLEKLVQKKAVRVMHWVEYISGDSADDVCVVWKDSFGGYDTMKKFVKPITQEYCSRENPLCVHQSATSLKGLERALLVGEAGQGKTWFLDSLGSEIKSNDPLQWVVVVKILEHRELLRDFSRVKELTLDHVVELVATAAGADTGAARRCLESTLRQTGALTLLVDGVDEVAPGYKQLTLQLLALLDRTPVRRLWVSTRPEVEPSLRDVLRSPPLALTPLNPEEQQHIMHRRLTSASPEKVLKYFSRWAHEVLGNPLQLRMVVDVINANPEFVKQQPTSMYDLYSEFVSLKYDKYERKYSRIPQQQGDFQEKHEKCAIVYLFADMNSTNELPLQEFAEYVRNDYSLSQAEEKTGIVWMDGKILKFTHHTYAEFFASKWLFRNANSCSGVRKFVKEMMKGNLRESRLLSFLRDQLSKKWPLHAAMWLLDMKEVESIMKSGFSSRQWDERDSLLHWIFGEYVDWAFQDAIQLFPEEIAFHDPWLVFAFRAAVESGCPLVAAEVMRRCDLPPSTLQLALRAAVKGGDDGHREVLRLLLEKGVKEDANRPDTLLHLAAERGRPLMVDLLLSHSQNVNARDTLMQIPLHLAIGSVPTSHKHKTAQRLLREQSVDVEAEDEDGWTPLCRASAADCIKCADSLLRRGAKVGGGSFPPLCAAAAVNNINTMRLLMQKGALLNAADKYGWTSLHLAVFNGRMEATQLLIFEGF